MLLLKNKFIFLISLVLVASFIISNCQLASAASDSLKQFNNSLQTTGNAAGYAKDLPIVKDSLTTTIAKFIAEALSFLGVIFLVLIIYGGYVWMKARGNETDVKRGRDIMINALVGLIIVVAAYAISYFVVGSFYPDYTP